MPSSDGFWHTSAWSVSSHAVRVAALFVLGRLIAETLGPAGFGAWGQVQNLVVVALGLTGVALQQGFVQGETRFREHPAALAAWRRDGLRLSLWGSFAAGLVVASLLMTRTVPLPGEVAVHGGAGFLIGLPALVLLVCWQGIATGTGRIRELYLGQAILPLIQALVVGGAVLTAGSGGLLAALSLWPALALLLVFPLLRPTAAGASPDAVIRWRDWAGFFALGAVPAVLGPLVRLALRSRLGEIDWDAAGGWQAAVQLVDLSVAPFQGAAAAWLLPRLVAAADPGATWRAGSLRVTAVVAVVAAGLAAGAPIWMRLAFGEAFVEWSEVLSIQALATVPHTLAWTIALILVARRRVKLLLILEGGSAVIHLGAGLALVPSLGVLAPPVAFLAENVVQLFVFAILWRAGRMN